MCGVGAKSEYEVMNVTVEAQRVVTVSTVASRGRCRPANFALAAHGPAVAELEPRECLCIS